MSLDRSELAILLQAAFMTLGVFAALGVRAEATDAAALNATISCSVKWSQFAAYESAKRPACADPKPFERWKDFLRPVGEAVRRAGPGHPAPRGFSLRLGSGKWKDFRADSVDMEWFLVDRLEPIRSVLAYWIKDGEKGGFSLIREKDGKTFSIGGPPVFSPDIARFATLEYDPYSDLDGAILRVWRFDPENPKLEEQKILSGATQGEIEWQGPDCLNVISVPDGKKRPVVSAYCRVGDRWKLQRGVANRRGVDGVSAPTN